MLRSAPCALMLLISLLALSATAEEAVKATGSSDAVVFLRVCRDAAGEPVALQTAVVRYQDPSRPEVWVDLVAAVHIGDRSYYQELNELFTSYDALLYELVAPEGTRISPDHPRGTSPVSALQTTMKDVLELEFQLDCVDYTRENFVHADMSPEQFAESMKSRNESFTQLFLRAAGQGIAQETQQVGERSRSNWLSALVKGNRVSRLKQLIGQEYKDVERQLKMAFSENRALYVKRAMAEELDDMEGNLAILNGPDGSTIVTERNKKALEVLRRELDAGKKHIGIFYGGAHLPDMQERLIDQFGLRPGKTRWYTAWSLAEPPAQTE